nr:MAG TPA: hypothetical protein [Crassvirales sp.]
MTKSKVGAEPKKKKVVTAVGKSEGIHEGIHRDEYGYYDSKYHCYCFAYGYFFHRGKSLAEKLTPDYIRDNWDEEMWCGGLKGTCMARIDRKRKIAVIKDGTEYTWSIEKGLPEGYTIYKTDEDIPVYDITESKNKKILIKMHVKYLIKKYLETFGHEYKVLNSISKRIPEHSFITANRNNYLESIRVLVKKYKFIPLYKPLSDKVFYVNSYKVKFPSIAIILSDSLFTDVQKEYIKRCKFYTKFCLHKGTSWAELNNKWSDEYVAEVEAKDKVEEEAFRKREAEYKIKTEQNYKAALAKANQTIDEWRKGDTKQEIHYTKYYANPDTREIKAINAVLYRTMFSNTQLRIKIDRPNWVETSRGALVPLETAINVFNQLYVDYILSGKTMFRFKRDEFKIGSFCVSSISYEDKFVDLIKCGHDEPEKLGYKEWKFCIGCHILWFDDIKDFARYYNLQLRLAFPLNRSTEECMKNHLIHLHSGKTIEAVGTINI